MNISCKKSCNLISDAEQNAHYDRDDDDDDDNDDPRLSSLQLLANAGLSSSAPELVGDWKEVKRRIRTPKKSESEAEKDVWQYLYFKC